MAREDPDFVPEMRYRDVQIRTIDSYEFDSVDFIKIDAEEILLKYLRVGWRPLPNLRPPYKQN
jgi:hypothetical protein